MVRYREEKDFLGKVRVPIDAYYGAETERALENFRISSTKVEPELIMAYAMIKRAAALANAKEGKLDKKIAAAIVRACDEILKGKFTKEFNLDVYQAGAGTSVNMNVNEVVANRACEILGYKKGDYKHVHPNDHVNMSQSTNDTYHAAVHVAAYISIRDNLLPALDGLERSLSKKASEFSRMMKIGRTHLQDAVPMTLGQEFSGYTYSIRLHKDNVKKAAEFALTLSVGGTAIGTGIETKLAYPKDFITELNKQTKIHFRTASNLFGVQQNQNEEIIITSALRNLAVALTKLANDLRLMNSGPAAGFGDITLAPVQPGSSIMPGKINPSMPEMLNMVCFQVIGMDSTVAHAAAGGQLELNVFMPLISHDLLYSIEILSTSIDTFTERCVKKIKANEEHLRSLIEKDMSLATALAPYIGYARAAEIARKAYRENKTVRQVCIELRVMPRQKLDKILDPRRLTRPTE
jgi:fumarate hydratase class II